MIIVSELGDKTFFIAAILAMTNNRRDIFLSASAALLVMTVLSVVLGMTLPVLLPAKYTHFASCVLFIVFGVKLLYSVITGDGGSAAEEMKEVEEEIHEAGGGATSPGADGASGADDSSVEMSEIAALESGESKEKSKKKADSHALSLRRCFSAVTIQCFTMTFFAEWGDRSQIATIAMAASKDPYGVTLGSFIAHSMCTGLAVIGGTLLASRISERTVNLIGGVLFLCFAATGFYLGPPTAAKV